MGKLMAGARINHVTSLLNFILLFINNEALIRKHRSDIILLLLTTDEEDFVLGLN
jgi:hypothetical protein